MVDTAMIFDIASLPIVEYSTVTDTNGEAPRNAQTPLPLPTGLKLGFRELT